MDFVEGLPRSKGFDTLLVVLDRFTKYGHFIGFTYPFSALTIATVFIKEIVWLHGFPASSSSWLCFWKELFRLHNTSLLHSTYHPQTDGKTEVVNKFLETYLRCFVNGKPRNWASWLPWAEFWYNTSPHADPIPSSIYGREAPHIICHGHGRTVLDSLDIHFQDVVLSSMIYELTCSKHSNNAWRQ